MWSSPAAALPRERSSPRRLLRAVEAPCSCELMWPERMTSSRSSKRPWGTFGALHIAFNNAGTEGQFGLLTTEQTVEHYHQVCDINIRGVLLSMKHEIPAMLRSGGGAIVNNSSVGGHIGFPGSSVYVASKFAVIGLTKTAGLEFARQGIRVNSVSPGPIQTEMFDRAFGEGETDLKKTIATQTPIGRIGTPEEIASAVLWLSSPGAAFITGQDITVDGGYTAQ